LTWHEGVTPPLSVIGGQPVVQPGGQVVMPIDDAFGTTVLSMRSTDGGVTWSNAVVVASISEHGVAAGLRTSALPSAEINRGGRVYVAWQDCRFRANCSSNDIVYSSSVDGLTWTGVRRVPIDGIAGTVDHFIPGLAVDRTTTGAGTHIGPTYYYYPLAACATATCQLDVGYVSSADAA